MITQRVPRNDRAQAERWAAGRADLVILSIEDGFAAVRDLAGALLRYEPETPR